MVDCIADPVAGLVGAGCSQACPRLPGGGAPAYCLDGGHWGHDIAAIVLDQRVDVGMSGRRQSVYRAIPASVDTGHDPPCDLGALCDPWVGTSLSIVGYGTHGTPGGIGADVHSALRQYGIVGITGCAGGGTTCLFSLPIGRPGDSGGPVFNTNYEDPAQDRSRRSLFGVFGYGGDQFVRVTHDDIRGFIETVLGPSSSGYPGTMVNVSPSGPAHAPIPPGGATVPVWTGDVDCPPVEESTDRDRFRTPDGRTADQFDPDGDGLAGIHDNCWGVRNPRQEFTDPNVNPVNGFTNAHHLCPRTSIRAVQCLPHTVACGASRGRPTTQEQSADPDNDHVESACDNCPCSPNTAQEDCDGDGIGDACESDVDGDHIPDDCDNCRFTRNADQANCNIDAESLQPIGHTPELLYDMLATPPRFGRGDACDPTPCGATEMQSRTVGDRHYMDQIHTAGVAREVRDVPLYPDIAVPGVGGAPATFVQPPGPGGYLTGYRACACSIATNNSIQTRQNCLNPVFRGDHLGTLVADGSGGCVIANQALSFPALVPENRTWRQVTTQVTATTTSIAALYTPEYRFVDPNNALFDQPQPPPLQTTLSLARDVERWSMDSVLSTRYPLGEFTVDLDRDPIGVVLWTQTLGPPARFPLPQRQLTRGYWSGRVDAPLHVLVLSPAALAAIAAPLDPGVCPRCVASFPTAFLAEIDIGHLSSIVFASAHVDADLVDPSFAAFDVPAVDQWVVSTDQSPRPEGIRAVGLSMHGTVIQSIIAQHDGAYVDEVIHGCPKQRCDLPTLDPSVAQALAVDPPPARDGYALAMSGAWRRLWLGGGVAAQGQGMNDIWEYDLSNQLWRQLEVSRDGRLGHVLALEWSSARQVLYALTEQRPHGHRQIALIRIDPSGDEAVVERTFTALHDTRFDLAVGPEDDMWIVSSSSDGGSYGVLRLLRTGRSDRFVVRSVTSGRGAVVPGAVSAEARGLSILLRHGGRSEAVGIPSGRERGRDDDGDHGHDHDGDHGHDDDHGSDGCDRWF